MASSANWPGQPTDNVPYPSGFASITGAMDAEGIASQKRMNDKYYYNPNAMDREHDIERGDLVWAISSFRPGSAHDRLFGIPRVRSSFNGLTGVPSTTRKLELIKDQMPKNADMYIQDLVSSHIQILGIAFQDHRFEREHVNALSSFAIQIAGIVQLLAQDYMPIGALAKAEPPTPAEWSATTWKRKRGTDPGKIPLMVTAVHPEDPSNFALRVVYRYIFQMVPKSLDPLMDSTCDKRVAAEYQYASSLAKFAVSCGLQMTKQLLRYDILDRAPLTEGYDPQPGDEGFGDPAVADTFNTAAYRNLSATDRQRRGRKQGRNVAPERRRSGLGHLLWYQNQGGQGGAIRYPPNDGAPVADLNAANPLLPEEAVTVLAKGMGAFGPVDVLQTDTRPESATDAAPRRGEWMAARLASDPRLAPERKALQRMTHEFLRSVFVSQHHDKVEKDKRAFEFGHMDYDVLNREEHIGRTQSSGANFVKPIDRRSLAGMLLSMQVNGLFDMTNGLTNVHSVFRSRIVGRVTKSAQAGRFCEIQLSKVM